VIGQRLGFVYADDQYEAVFRRPLLDCLAGLIAERGDDTLRARCLTAAGEVKPGLVVGSPLRAAPAIGAAVSAYEDAFGALKSAGA